jgi:hypothetical protein
MISIENIRGKIIVQHDLFKHSFAAAKKSYLRYLVMLSYLLNHGYKTFLENLKKCFLIEKRTKTCLGVKYLFNYNTYNPCNTDLSNETYLDK